MATTLGLPDATEGCLFDLDGVLTNTAVVHAAAWKAVFDTFLTNRGAPFDEQQDYRRYVDGRSRADGARAFLVSRGITVDDDVIARITERKDELFSRHLAERGVEVYEGSRRYLEAVGRGGLRRAVVSASRHAAQVLEAASLASMVEVLVDGVTMATRHLEGKPAPDTFLAGAAALGVAPAQAVVFEDAVAGVAAGHRGGFGWVIGVDRTGHADDLREGGADLVVTDLAELLADD